ncbi:hypothetical protein E8E12_001851 [Didymella heteroderae]|uniref:CCHC-type domain-containing protein n=1 Tax=Didymella heteroderae TaxID=1769908 RepID=A0A9P4WIE5_9PLEO|nr:hypothetical protein E8E12_001851 [Didymella heteroderae]
MARVQLLTLPPGMSSEPYHKGKEKVGQKTLCETCDRVIMSRDWPAHQNSKGHRNKKEAIKDKENLKKNNDGTDTWVADTSNFTLDAGFGLASPDSGWGNSGSGEAFGTSSTGNKTSGGQGCFKCGETGHRKADCPQGGSGGGGQGCFKCGEVGHRKADCPQGGSGGGGKACFNCGNEGHRKTECPEPLKPRAGGGGGRTCFNCLQPGHNISDCPKPRVERCRNCDAVGHMSRECDKPKDWSRVKCTNCSKHGHGAKRCPEPEATGDAYGDGSNGWDAPADSGVAVGGWDNAGAEPSTAAGVWAGDDFGSDAGTGESWADQATAEAQW